MRQFAFSRGVVRSFASLFAKTNVDCFLGISLAAAYRHPLGKQGWTNVCIYIYTHACASVQGTHIYVFTYMYVNTWDTYAKHGFVQNEAYPEDKIPNHRS